MYPLLHKMTKCQTCESEISENEPYCPYCGNPNHSEEAEIIREIDEYKEKRKKVLATFLLGMFGIMLIPFFRLVLATVSFGIAIPMSIYYSWKKYQAENELNTIKS